MVQTSKDNFEYTQNACYAGVQWYMVDTGYKCCAVNENDRSCALC